MGLCHNQEQLKDYGSKKKKKKQIQNGIGVQKTKVKRSKSSVFNNQNQKQIIRNSVFNEIRKIFKKPFDINLVYKASQGHYLASQFHQASDGLKNTILFVKTTENRIFGAFTTCQWRKDTLYKYQTDQNKNSFVFGLHIEPTNTQSVQQQKIQTPQQKEIQCKIFRLHNKERAIMNHSSSGPIFGQGHDIYIMDKCNLNQSWCNLGKSYECRYPYGSVKANHLLAGQSKFFVVEYQLWEVVFEKEKQK